MHTIECPYGQFCVVWAVADHWWPQQKIYLPMHFLFTQINQKTIYQKSKKKQQQKPSNSKPHCSLKLEIHQWNSSLKWMSCQNWIQGASVGHWELVFLSLATTVDKNIKKGIASNDRCRWIV